MIHPEAGDEIDITGLVLPFEIDPPLLFVLEYVETEAGERLMDIVSAESPLLKSRSYPNPFNPAARIEFELQIAGMTTLTIYDLKGAEIGTLLNGYLDAGLHSVAFTPTNLSAGTYLYVLESAGIREFGRMIYMK